MALRKRKSKILDDAEMRANNLEAIDPNLDLGGGLTLAKFKQAIADGRAKLNTYNQTLSLADQQGNDVGAAEKVVGDYSKRMLAGIGATRGTDSSEYEMAGGTRDSERKKSDNKKKKGTT
ncbi:MAG TPA: hypothetical protein VKB86_05130 [Pyrinomonadaceae bacterium]|nr:hypothetical protein [Pyrinomonadaceae bacterium]